MRLGVLDHGHRMPNRAFLRMVSARSGVEMVDIVKTLLYRPEFFGRPLLALTVPAMRGPSYWTVGEREYLAYRAALRHRCPFCIDSHREMTRLTADGEIDPEDSGSERPELSAILRFLDATTADPDRVDVTEPREAGVTGRAVMEALHVDLVWNTVNRLGNAFGFELRPGQLESGTRALNRLGYRMPRVFLGGKAPAGPGGLVADLRFAVYEAPATTDPPLRAAAATGDGAALVEPWRSYTALVRDAGYRIGDAELDRLRAAGHSEDEIFEVTVAAGLGAALRSFDAGRAAVSAAAPA